MTTMARRLRRDETLAERLLWEELRDRRLGGFKWKRQVPRVGYVVDFCCNAARLAVEIDGWVHEYILGRAQADLLRTQALEREGLRIVRFTNQEVIDKRSMVCEVILHECRAGAPSPNPLPRKRRVRGL
jgi:very-short-patch-repair endonuclease